MRLTLTLRLACLAVLVSCISNAYGQFTVRESNLVDQQIGGHYAAYFLATNPVDQQWADDRGFFFLDDVEDFKEEFDYVNLGGGGGWFNDANGTPLQNGGFFLGEDYIIDARARVTIPEGTWTVSFNSDDGGQLTIPGVNFTNSFRVDDPFAKGGPEQIFFRGNRGHQATGATFTVPAGGLETILHSTMHERGGGDSFEITVRPGGPGSIDPRPDTDDDWLLLEDGAHGWSVSPTDDLPERNPLTGLPLSSAGGVGGVTMISPSTANFPLASVTPGASPVIRTIGDGTEVSQGLNQRWYQGGNPGNLNGQLSRIATGDEIARFTNEETWWKGASANHSAFQSYPEEVDGAGDPALSAAEGANNDNYMAWLNGEINMPAGDTRFRLAIDDYKYFAIDTGGNGVAGDQPGEILMDNNQWVDAGASRGGLDWANTVIASTEEAGWRAIDIIMAEGGGGDSAILYWDEGNEDNFPFVAPFSDAQPFAPEDYAVPADRLRSVERGDVEEVALVAAMDGVTVNLEVSSAARDSDQLSLRNPDLATEINLAGATLNVLALDGEELRPGDQWVLFDTDSLTGLDEATINLAGGNDQWDITGLLSGTTNRITFLGGGVDPCEFNYTFGDTNCDDLVNFQDFVTLSSNFGQAGDGTGGDTNADGMVNFQDFVTLSSNFGQPVPQAAAASIPEPTSLGLVALGLCGILQFRRRR